MHICHVITRLIIGGAQENTVLSCEGLRELGHRVTLISGPTRGPEGSLLERVRAGGYALIEIPELIRSINPWYDVRAGRELTRLFEDLRPDVVHTHSSKAGILGRFAATRAQVPRILHTVHGMSFNRTQSWPVRFIYAALERRAALHCDHIVNVADAMGRQLLAAGVGRADRISTIRSGMEVDHFHPDAGERDSVRAEWRVPSDAVVVGTIARLFLRKGYEQLLPIMARAAAHDPRLHFVWVGDGSARPRYEAELQRLGLSNRTTLVGLVPPSAIPRLLRGFDILAHASQWEGLPRAVVQALLTAVPAVAFDIDGTPEVVHDGRTGRLIRLGDEAAFADAICSLSADAALRASLGAAGRELCLREFDWREMVSRLDDLYRSIPPRTRPDHRR
ncbi:MAG: glycosyltransferase family 4 protein [Planctomycetia bacterium]|nr:MAG: glycosyltransferase family 4 protein [Planctomycetia bacterium]